MILLHLVSVLLACFLLFIACGHLPAWYNLMAGFSLGFLPLYIVLGVVGVLSKFGTPLLWILRRCLLVLWDSRVHVFVADVVKSSDTVDTGILDRVLGDLGLPAWFGHSLLSCACSPPV